MEEATNAAAFFLHVYPDRLRFAYTDGNPSPPTHFPEDSMRLVLWLLVFLGLATGGMWLFKDGDEPRLVLVRRGASLAAVSAELEREGVVTNALVTKVLLRVTGGSSRVRAGEFSFRRAMGPGRALLTLYFGEPILHKVTIPEGWNVRLIAKALANEKLVDEAKFIELALSRETAKKYKLDAPGLEGYLYPETYNFSRVDGEERILDIVVQEFFKHYTDAMKAEAKALGFTTEQLITLASIVEKETGGSDERETVASVFHNRLKKRMRLQSDPTTIYGIQNFNGNLTKADLLRPSEYNTYTIPRLPPGPIASPGLRTIVATLHPAQTEYLYFVANNKGGHVFSKTYEEHENNVDLYQRGGRSRKKAEAAATVTTSKREPNAVDRRPAASRSAKNAKKKGKKK